MNLSKKKKNNLSRWRVAQNEELSTWRDIREIVEKPRGELSESWSDWLNGIDLPSIDENSTILDIGNGPHGIVQDIPKGIRFGLDPLISDYKCLYKLPTDVNFVAGIGEYLPFKDNKIDLVFVVNTLDHVIDPNAVLKEVKRACKNFLILDLNTTPLSDKILMKFGYRPRLNVYHPHKIVASELIQQLNSLGFKILDIYYEAHTHRPTFMLHPILSFFKKNSNVEEKEEIYHTESKFHINIKTYFLKPLNFFLFPISKKRFSDYVKIVAYKKNNAD